MWRYIRLKNGRRAAQTEELDRGDVGETGSGSAGCGVVRILQPIEMRVDELIAGIRADVAVKLFGDDLDSSCKKRRKKSSASSRPIPGAEDVKAEATSGLAATANQTRPRRYCALRFERRRC